ncbi:MAG: sarcosine oxidase subunit gamma [Gammaproteobacteria bacterium]|nr:sarcosine oxidase subunit gamma [Gammaproteobacteria bacterium]
MVDRVSALAGHNPSGHQGDTANTGVILREPADLVLHQVAAWQDSIDAVGKSLARLIGAKSVAGPCSSVTGSKGAMLRIEPMKWWLVGVAAPVFDAEQAVTLDLSHSRTRLCVSGDNAAEFLNRHFPLDLREASFPVGAVASSATHHVGVTLWRSQDGYELFIPRGFALSLWEGFVESAQQFGLEIA